MDFGTVETIQDDKEKDKIDIMKEALSEEPAL